MVDEGRNADGSNVNKDNVDLGNMGRASNSDLNDVYSVYVPR